MPPAPPLGIAGLCGAMCCISGSCSGSTAKKQENHNETRLSVRVLCWCVCLTVSPSSPMYIRATQSEKRDSLDSPPTFNSDASVPFAREDVPFGPCNWFLWIFRSFVLCCTNFCSCSWVFGPYFLLLMVIRCTWKNQGLNKILFIKYSKDFFFLRLSYMGIRVEIL